MVTVTPHADNQLAVNPSSSPKTKTTKMVHRKKHIHCNKNLRDQTNYISPLIATNK